MFCDHAATNTVSTVVRTFPNLFLHQGDPATETWDGLSPSWRKPYNPKYFLEPPLPAALLKTLRVYLNHTVSFCCSACSVACGILKPFHPQSQ